MSVTADNTKSVLFQYRAFPLNADTAPIYLVRKCETKTRISNKTKKDNTEFNAKLSL